MKKKCQICGSIAEYQEEMTEKCLSCQSPGSFLETVKGESKEEQKVFKNAVVLEKENPAVQRIPEKCIDCGRCQSICEKLVGISYDHTKAREAICINCGQCILNCPVGALVPKYQYKKVLDYLHDTSKIVTISIAPAVRSSLGSAFGYEEGSFVLEEMIAALRKAGFDYVFDVTFGADMTIMEEASELLERLETKQNLPMFTSCCPAWVNYIELYHPNLRNHLSTTKSPISIQGALLNSYFLEMKEIEKSAIINVVVVPCTAKKYEITREELKGMDFALTTTELALLLKESNIMLESGSKASFDALLGEGSGAGTIFGSSGGVMEASLRTAYYLATRKAPPLSFLETISFQGEEALREREIQIGDRTLKVAVVYGLPHVEPLLKEVEQGRCNYDFIEVMNCPLGCVGGGGQSFSTISKQKEISKKRSHALYERDQSGLIHNSYESADVKAVYQSYLGKPLSTKAKELLHTSYEDKSAILGE